MTFLVQELRAALAAMIYFTRLPLPALRDSTLDDWRRAATYFPAVGWVVGGAGAAAWWAAARVLPGDVACGISLVVTVLLTGAMHEDGLADTCDGLGGGTTRERALEIMRDSRIGSYGAVGLVLLLGLKWRALAALDAALLPAALVAAHALSRAAAISILASLDYARAEGKARAVVSRLRWPRLVAAGALGLAPLALLPMRLWWAVVPVVLVRAGATAWFRRRLDGYTGDCLGGAQQVSELACLLAFVALPLS